MTKKKKENDIITMNKKELYRYEIIQRCLRKELTEKEGAEILSLSLRQVQRLKQKVREKGIQGLIHGNRGKKSHNRLTEKERKKIVRLLLKHYFDFKPTHATEKLREIHGINRDPKTIRQIMIEEGLWKPKKKKNKSIHRAWRQRKAHFGEMVQFDGSYEYWLKESNTYCCLLLAVDDATGALLYGNFTKDESVFSVFQFWRQYLLKYGKPLSIYLDRFSTYKMAQGVAKNNHDLKTQFERAMQELQIETIFAYSPQAKGRVERAFGTLQDRLIKEMRLRQIATLEEANKYLLQEFIPWYNSRYSQEPRSQSNFHQALTEKEKKRLVSIFSKQKERVIQNDFTVSYQNRWYQLIKDQPVTVCKKDKVIVEERPDGQIFLRLRGKYLNIKPLPEHASKPKPSLKTKTWILPATARGINLAKENYINSN